MLKIITAGLFLGHGADAVEMSCIDHKKIVKERSLCDRALIAINDHCTISPDSPTTCQNENEMERLEKCERGRRELIELNCLPRDCSCDIDDLQFTSSKVNMHVFHCNTFRNQYFTNPCFSHIEDLQLRRQFSIPYDSQYSYVNRDKIIRVDTEYRTESMQLARDHSYTVATVLLFAIGVAILVVLGLIGYLWNSSRSGSSLDLSKDDLRQHQPGRIVITDDKMDEIVRAELNRYSTKRKAQEKTPEKRTVVALPEKC
ncbi:Oidioi.mRNA.OKI2018_I69.chr2.g5943.t1.cds [Oikopleura dioica]|uniref:Oidioi.mRNA.OKI2018_I69.chr2.g5943.t1.cds n=1 Tax=Oikopleura dioica TaxID=34765 RepID=A0ABN7T1J7_OIKDI|nr:Oidioi.mRNA.OKI2018_I69.chr2.g5943.t1.cds [Oikopleura dioica]